MPRLKPEIIVEDLTDTEIISRAADLLAKAVLELVREQMEKKKALAAQQSIGIETIKDPLYIEESVRFAKGFSSECP